MAVINETLTLEDRFSASFTRFLQLGDKAAGATTRARNSLQNYEAELNRLDRQTISYNGRLAALNQEQAEMAAKNLQNTKEYKNLESQIKQTASTLKALESQYNAVAADADKAAASAKKLGVSLQETQKPASGLMGSLRNLAGAFLGIQTGQWLVGTSDQLTQINARLQLMTGSAEAAAEANDQIYQAAMRARGAYTDMADLVSQLGTLAPNAFSDTGEIVAFAEQLQKQMALSGTSTMAAQAAMLQLTQGLASGVLRGEELNSVLEQTPMVAQTIADYMGVNVGTMRELASEGAITADVVKNALLGAAQETNAAFEQMPMTWGQVWNQMQNIAIQALQPVLDAINFVANNLETIGPIVAGVAGAFIAYAAATAISTAATWLAVAANRALMASMLTNPILLVAVAIGIVIAAIAQWVQSIGGLEVAWLTAVDAVLLWWDNLKIGILEGVYNIQNFLSMMAFAFQYAGVSIVNWVGDMKVNVLTLLQDMVNGAIGLINNLINAVNTIPGVAISPLEEVSFATNAAVENEAAKQARNAQIEADRQAMYREIGQRRSEIDLMTADAYARHYERQNEITSTRLAAQKAGTGQDNNQMNNYPTYDQVAGATDQLSGINSSVKGIEKAVDMSDEDLKALVDVAERRYVNQVNLTSQTPVITVNGANTGRTAQDRRELADAIEQILREEWASGSVRSTAYA